MSQSGKVLHLYVEVRSASDPSVGEKTFGEHRRGSPLDRSGLKDNARELLSQLGSRPPPGCRSPSLKRRHRSPPPDCGKSRLSRAIGSPGVSERRSRPCDLTTPTKARSNWKEGIDGTRSVVSFSYVRKANVKTRSSPGTSRERSDQVGKSGCQPFWRGSPKLTLRHSSGSRPALDLVGMAATRRASEDLGSPLLRIKVAHARERLACASTYHPARCQSWSGSPVPHRNMKPKSRGTWGWPLSRPSDRRSSQSQSPLFGSRGPARWRDDVTEGLNQLSDVSKRSASRWIPPERSGATSPHQSLEMNIPVHTAVGRPLPRSGQSSCLPPRVHRPSRPPTELSSPIRDPGAAALRAPDSPTPHRCRTPRYTGGNLGGSGCRERGDRSELTPKAFVSRTTEEALEERRSAGLFPDGEQTCAGSVQRGSLKPTTQQKRAERRRRERLLLGPVIPDSPDADSDYALEAAGGPSRSSSGVTGSLGDRECPSPESLASGHRGNRSGASTSGIQTDSAAPVLSLHCQKIARAKWEFLFGPEEGASSSPANFVEASTAPPSGNSSESPTPTPPSSLPLLAASQHVRHVEVELVTPPPAHVGRCPETGVICRTLKYSETDLDAVPLRCYRETDMDELPMGGRDDRDSAFGSNRSVGEGSPQGSGQRPHGFWAEGEASGQRQQAAEEEEDDEVVSWASVRMRGDDRKQQEQEQGFPCLKRASECFLDGRQPALKSPVRLLEPGRAGEDAFSRHFESIVESARAKGTSRHSPEGPAGDSDATRAPSSERLSGGWEDTPPGRRGRSGPPPPSVPSNDFSRLLAEEYLRLFDFSHLRLDQALRVFLKLAVASAASDDGERLLWPFSCRYLLCNPTDFPSEDAVHTLVRALMALNKDLHGPNVGAEMSCPQFVDNLDGLNDGRAFPKHLLQALYNSIKTQKLQWTLDEEELRKSFSELGDSLCDSSRSAKAADDDGTLSADETAACGTPLYKNGFLVRKVHADSDGKRTPRGKRGWKTFYAILKGLILYLQKGEYRADKPLTDGDLKNAVSVHHSLAIRAADYGKRANVFYLRTADWRLFLFQAPNAEQMHSWISSINTVAATFSAPPFPPAVASQKKFSRPLLPGNMSKLSQEEQLRSHEARLRAVASELAELRSCPPQRKLKGRQLDQHQQRDQHLHFEKTRYETYVALLRAKMEGGDGGEAEPGEDEGALPRSGPALRDSSQAGAARADVQRRSYRQAVKK